METKRKTEMKAVGKNERDSSNAKRNRSNIYKILSGASRWKTQCSHALSRENNSSIHVIHRGIYMIEVFF